jgi:hypothetical protein
MAQYIASIQIEAMGQNFDMDTVHSSVQKLSGSLSVFLHDSLKIQTCKELGRTQKQVNMVSKFLQGWSIVNSNDIVKLTYEHHDSTPKAAHTTVA